MSVMYRRMSFLGSLCALASLSYLALTEADAAPTFGYSIIPAPSSAPGQVVASPSPVSASSSHTAAVSGGNVALSAMTGAGYGLLNGGSHATLNLPDYSFGASGFAQTSADFGMDNIVISGPPGEVVTYSVNGSISGGIGASMSGTGSIYSAAAVTLKFSTCSSFGGFGNAPLGSMSVDGGGGVSRTGIFANFPVESMSNNSWTSPTWQARSGDAISVGMVLETSAAVDHRFGGTGFMDAYADFSRTAMFSTTGPVFNLPPGWTGQLQRRLDRKQHLHHSRTRSGDARRRFRLDVAASLRPKGVTAQPQVGQHPPTARPSQRPRPSANARLYVSASWKSCRAPPVLGIHASRRMPPFRAGHLARLGGSGRPGQGAEWVAPTGSTPSAFSFARVSRYSAASERHDLAVLLSHSSHDLSRVSVTVNAAGALVQPAPIVDHRRMLSLTRLGAALGATLAFFSWSHTVSAADVPEPLTYRVALLGNPCTPVTWDEAQVKALADAGFNAVQLNIAWLRRPHDEPLNLIDVVTRPGDVEPARTAERRAELLRRCALAKKFGLRTIFHFGSPFMWRNPETGEIKRGQSDAYLADPQWFDVGNPKLVEYEVALLKEFRRQFPDVDDIQIYTYDQDAWQTSEFDERELSRGIPLHERLPRYVGRLHEVWTEGREGHRLWWEPWELSAGQVYKCVPQLPTREFGLMLHVNIAETQITRPVDVWFQNTVRMAAARGIPVVPEAFFGSATEEIEPLSIPCPRLVDEQFQALTAVPGVAGLKEYFGLLPLVPDLNLDMFKARVKDPEATTDQLLDQITERFGPQQAEVKRLMEMLAQGFEMFPWDASWHIRTVGLATVDHGWDAAFIRGAVADTPSWHSTRRAHFMSTDDQQPHPWMLEDVQLRCELAADTLTAAAELSRHIASTCPDEADKALFEGIGRDTEHFSRIARSYALHLRETNVALLLRRDLENGRPMSPKLLEEMKALLAADVANQNGGERVVAMQKEFEADPADFIAKRLVPTTKRSAANTHNVTTR